MRLALRIAGVCLSASLASAGPLKTPIWADAPLDALEIELGGEPVVARSLATTDASLIVLIVMDTIRFPDRTDAAREAIIRKLAELGTRKCFVGVLTAQDGLTVRQDPTRNRRRLREKLAGIEVRGVPGLLDVVEQASLIADGTLAAAPVRVATLFITDSGVEDYRGDYTIPVVNPSDRRDLSRRFRDQLIRTRVRAIVDTLEMAQAPLFFLHLARQRDDLNEVYQNGIAEFAAVTGGQALFAQGLQEIPSLVERLLDTIAAHSVLHLETDCEGLRKLQVQAPGTTPKHRERVGCPPPPPQAP